MNPARSLNATSQPPTVSAFDEIRTQRSQELEEKEHNRRHLEADQKRLVLEIENARLRRTLNRPEPAQLTPHQERVNWIADQVEQAEFSCKTIADSVERELRVHSEIEAKRYHPDPDTDAHIKAQMKSAFSVSFERLRMDVGGDVQIEKKNHR